MAKTKLKIPRPAEGARWYRLLYDDVKGEWIIVKVSNWTALPRNIQLYERGLVRATDTEAMSLCDRLNSATQKECMI